MGQSTLQQDETAKINDVLNQFVIILKDHGIDPNPPEKDFVEHSGNALGVRVSVVDQKKFKDGFETSAEVDGPGGPHNIARMAYFLESWYGLSLSQGAHNQLQELETGYDPRPRAITNREMRFYQGYLRDVPSGKGKTVVHEAWHCVEDRLEVFTMFPLINEGTATFIESWAVGEPIVVYPASLKAPSDFLYTGMASVAQDVVGRMQNPYTALLDYEIRKEISHRFITSDLARQLVFAERSERIQGRKTSILRQRYTSNNGFREFRRFPTVANLARGYRRAGAPQLASELEQQLEHDGRFMCDMIALLRT